MALREQRKAADARKRQLRIRLVVGAGLGEERVTVWTLGGLAFVLGGCALVLRKPPEPAARG